MGIIRGGLVFVICVLLFFSFLAMDLSYTLNSSLSYNHVQGDLTVLVKNITSSQAGNLLSNQLNISNPNLNEIIQQHSAEIETFCADYPNYSFDFQGYNVTLPCNQINQGKNVTADTLINQSVKSFVHEVYYKNYNCSFWSCFGNNKFPFFLVSQQAQSYWKGKFYTLLLISLALIASMFFVLEKKLNLPIVTGGVLVLASLPLVKLGALLSEFLGYPFILLFNIFFSQSQRVFWTSIIIGILLVAVGVTLRVVNSGTVKWISSKADEIAAKGKTKKKDETVKVDKTQNKDLVKKQKK